MGTLKELLATPDRVRITTPPLPAETMRQVLELIKKETAEGKVRIDNPTQNLESYFLGIVQRAREMAEQTSGATSGNRVAAYLQGEGVSASQPERVLERLVASAPTPAPALAPSKPELEAGLKRLDSLALPAQPAVAPAPAAATEPKPDLAKANEKLSSLLNKPK